MSDSTFNPANAMNEAEAIKDAAEWWSATDSLIEFWTAKGRCYSSGEVAACLRTHRMDLRFSVPTLGEYLRNRFYGSDSGGYGHTPLPSYTDDQGDEVPPVQHSRYTQGLGRTGSGVLVFVYGPDVDACDLHDFEVDIPRPGTQNGAVTDGPQTPAPRLKTPASDGLTSRPVPGDLPMAYVDSSSRCYVARKVVDAYLGAANISLRQGQETLHVHLDAGKAVISYTATPGSTPYNIWKGSGRVAFYSPTGVPFTEGTKYPVSVDANGIIVDLGSPEW